MIRTIRMRVYPGPCQGGEEIAATLKAVRAYKNKLTEIQRDHRRKWQEERTKAAPAFAAAEEAYKKAEQELDELLDKTKAARAKARKGEKAPPEIAAARTKKKEAAAKLKEERQKIDPAVLKAITERFQREEADAVKAAKAASGLTSPAAYEAEQDLLRAKKSAGHEGPRFRSHDGGGTIPIQIPAAGMSERVLLDALRDADLHASAAKALSDAGRIKLIRGKAPLYVTDELREDGTPKTVELGAGLKIWRDTNEAHRYHGHSEQAREQALTACVPLKTWGDLTSGRLSGVSLDHLTRAEWRKAWPKGRGDRPGQQQPDPNSIRRGDDQIAYGLVRMQVNRDKAEAVIPVCEPRDRLPPPGAQVKQVELHVRRLGVQRNGAPRLRYSVLATVDDPRPRPGKKRGVVAVNVGWRPRPDGSVRVAYYVGSDGDHGELCVPKELLDALEHAESLRAARDRVFDLAKARVSQFLSALGEPPPWLVEVLRKRPRSGKAAEGATETEEDVVDAGGGLRPKHILLWRDARRLERLLHAWREHRLPGDEEIFRLLAGPLRSGEDCSAKGLHEGQDNAWLAKHFHLLSWEQDARRTALAQRKALFQGWGKKLGERYGTLLLEDFDLTEERKRPKVEDGTQKERTPLVKLMNAAAPGELREWLAMGMESRGGQVVRETVPLATQRCHRCSSEERWDAARSIIHTCRACGTLWDQDENNCRNRLAVHVQAQHDERVRGLADGMAASLFA